MDNYEIDLNDEFMQFQDEDENPIVEEFSHEKWKILIVDDEDVIHTTTKLVLKDFSFENKKLEFLSAYTSKEAKNILEREDGIALILLDVVMESDNAGLELVKYIREDLNNNFIRIILRTGQPGQAPEERIIIDYDINDYKTKTELTVQKLFTTIISSLRAYQDLIMIEKNRKGLREIVDASKKLFEINSLRKFASGLIMQLSAMYGFDNDALYLRSSGFAVTDKNGDRVVLAATGEFAEYIDKNVEELHNPEILALLDEAKEKKTSIVSGEILVGYYRSLGEIDNFVLFKGIREIDSIDREMIDLFSANISVAFDNVYLNERIINTQKDVIYKLGEVVESRSEETSNHVRKVSEYVFLLAIKYGIDYETAEVLKVSASMHDIGKIGIAQNILLKADKLTKEELDEVKKHSYIGYSILKVSNLKLMQVASVQAYEHHENFDGSGYPRGISGEDIHIYGRILAIADVFDTMTRDTVYRKKLSTEEAFKFIADNRGKKFDPKLVDLFLSNKEDILDILNKTNFEEKA